MPKAMTLIQSQVLATSALTVTFNSIPSTYRDLYLVYTGTMTSTATGEGTALQLNGDTGTNYFRVQMVGNGSTASSSSASSWDRFFPDEWSTSNPAAYRIHFLDYSATDKHKTFLTRVDNASSTTVVQAGRWASTAAISSIVLYATDVRAGTPDSWAAGSTFSLYGIVG